MTHRFSVFVIVVGVMLSACVLQPLSVGDPAATSATTGVATATPKPARPAASPSATRPDQVVPTRAAPLPEALPPTEAPAAALPTTVPLLPTATRVAPAAVPTQALTSTPDPMAVTLLTIEVPGNQVDQAITVNWLTTGLAGVRLSFVWNGQTKGVSYDVPQILAAGGRYVLEDPLVLARIDGGQIVAILTPIDIAGHPTTVSAGPTQIAVTLACRYAWFGGDGYGLPCPIGPAQALTLIEQRFEGGRMLTDGSRSGTIYALTEDGFARDLGSGFAARFPTPEPLTPPEGLYAPEGDFGYWWRVDPTLRERLGWAIEPERLVADGMAQPLMARPFPEAGQTAAGAGTLFRLGSGQLIHVDGNTRPEHWQYVP